MFLQGNNFEQSDHLQRTTQANMKSDNVTKMNRPPLFSFGNHSKNFPAQSFKYNSPTLTTIIESKLTNDSSPSGLGNPPDVPKTSPPSSELPNTSSLLQHHTDRTLHSTGNPSTFPDNVISIFESPPPSCCYPHYLQSVARPCRTQSSLPVQIRPDFHPNLGQTESHTTGLHPDPHRPHTKNFISFLNSQIHKTSDLPEIIVLPFQGVPLEQASNQSLPASVELAGNVQTPETTQQSSEEVNKEILENWQSTHFPKSVNDSQSINKPEIYQSTSASSVNNFELSASSDSGYGVSSLFPLGISRLQHYRGFNISPNDINSNDSDSIDRRRYCTRCHLCTLVCECSSSDENGKIFYCLRHQRTITVRSLR